jgi:hypothetical protein
MAVWSLVLCEQPVGAWTGSYKPQTLVNERLSTTHKTALHLSPPTSPSSSPSTDDIKADIARMKEEAQRRFEALSKQVEDYHRDHPSHPQSAAATPAVSRKQDTASAGKGKSTVDGGLPNVAYLNLESTKKSHGKESDTVEKNVSTSNGVQSSQSASNGSSSDKKKTDSSSRGSLDGFVMNKRTDDSEVDDVHVKGGEEESDLAIKRAFASSDKPATQQRVVDLTHGKSEPTRYDLLDDTMVRSGLSVFVCICCSSFHNDTCVQCGRV